MDKFDQSIKQAVKTHQPKSNFVEVTMHQITQNHQPKSRRVYRFWAPLVAGGLAVIALVFIVLPGGGSKQALNTSSQTPQGTTSPSSTQSSPASGSGATNAGDNNAALNSDLNSIGNSINKENNDQGSANSALNDQSQEISVPTS